MLKSLTLVCAALSAALALADVAGTWQTKGPTGDLSLTLTENPDNTVTGVLSAGRTSLAVTARLDDGKAVGSVGSDDLPGKSYFMARKEGDGLTVVLADMDRNQQPRIETVRKLSFTSAAPGATKAPAANPTIGLSPFADDATAAQPNSAPAPAAADPVPAGTGAGTSAKASGKVYKHPSGGILRYPETWDLKETPSALQFIPPNMGPNPDAVFLVTAENVGNITRPDDPQLIQMINALIAQQLPQLKRVGNVENIQCGSQAGAGLVWEAVGQTGIPVRANLYVTIIKGQAISLLALGAKPRVMEHDKTIREIFSSFAWGQSQIDNSLVGTWNYWSYHSSGSGANMTSSETSRTCVLKGDGTFTMRTKGENYMSAKNANSQGDVTSQGSAVGASGDGTRGTWAAGDGKLYLTFDNGTSFGGKYEIKPNSAGHRILTIDDGGKKPQEWSEGR